MAISWSKEYTDADGMFHSDWTANGGSLGDATIDAWGIKQFNGDGTNNSISQGGIILAADGATISMGFWYTPLNHADTAMIYSQGSNATSDNRILIYAWGTGKIAIVFESGSGDKTRMFSGVIFTTGQQVHVGIGINGADELELYLDGVPTQSGIKTGAGFTGLTSDAHDSIIGSDGAPTAFAKTGTGVSRFKIARSDYGSAAEFLEEYTAEEAAKLTLWTPAEITTDLWLDAADTDTITDSLGDVSQWDDKSGNGRNATQGTGSNQPVVGTKFINGLDAIEFDGANDHLDVSTIGTGEDITMVVVWQQQVNTTGVPVFVGTSASDDGLGIGYNNSSTKYNIFVYGGTTEEQTGQAINVTKIQVGTHTASGNVDLFMNGTQLGPTSGSSLDITNGAVTIGQSRDNDGNTVEGMIGEVLVFARVLTTEDRQLVEGYLAWKWGLQASLPVGHPYEFAAPTVEGGASTGNATWDSLLLTLLS